MLLNSTGHFCRGSVSSAIYWLGLHHYYAWSLHIRPRQPIPYVPHHIILSASLSPSSLGPFHRSEEHKRRLATLAGALGQATT